MVVASSPRGYLQYIYFDALLMFSSDGKLKERYQSKVNGNVESRARGCSNCCGILMVMDIVLVRIVLQL